MPVVTFRLLTYFAERLKFPGSFHIGIAFALLSLLRVVQKGGSMPVGKFTDASTRLVDIPIGTRKLNGFLDLSPQAEGLVVFAHGSGSGRFSTRNRFVASALQDAGLGTLLLDLLDDEEAADREKVFDIPLLAQRLLHVIHWLRHDRLT